MKTWIAVKKEERNVTKNVAKKCRVKVNVQVTDLEQNILRAKN